MSHLTKIQLFRKSRKNQEDEEEHEAPRVAEISKPIRNDEEEHIPEDHDMTEPQRPEELPSEMISRKRRPAWAREIIEDAERYGAPKVTI